MWDIQKYLSFKNSQMSELSAVLKLKNFLTHLNPISDFPTKFPLLSNRTRYCSFSHYLSSFGQNTFISIFLLIPKLSAALTTIRFSGILFSMKYPS